MRLEDGDPAPIARALLGALPPKGHAPFKTWQLKRKAPGVQVVTLKKTATGLKLVVKAKKWFTAAAADEPAASTRFTVTIGGQCLTQQVTKKTD